MGGALAWKASQRLLVSGRASRAAKALGFSPGTWAKPFKGTLGGYEVTLTSKGHITVEAKLPTGFVIRSEALGRDGIPFGRDIRIGAPTFDPVFLVCGIDEGEAVARLGQQARDAALSAGYPQGAGRVQGGQVRWHPLAVRPPLDAGPNDPNPHLGARSTHLAAPVWTMRGDVEQIRARSERLGVPSTLDLIAAVKTCVQWARGLQLPEGGVAQALANHVETDMEAPFVRRCRELLHRDHGDSPECDRALETARRRPEPVMRLLALQHLPDAPFEEIAGLLSNETSR